MQKVNQWKFPRLVFAIFILFFLCLYGQYAYISLFKEVYGINMSDFASARSTYEAVIEADRGKILDKDGNSLALNVSSYTLIAYLDEDRGTKNYVSNIEITAQKLSEVLGAEATYFLTILTNGKAKGLYQVEFGTYGSGLSELTKEKITNLSLDGLGFVESQKRYYPNGDFASYIVGYAKNSISYSTDGLESIKIVGELGIESQYNSILEGTNGYIKYQKDKNGYKIPNTKEEKVEAVNGNDIYLTIDSNIQRFAENAVKSASEVYDPEWLIVTVMNAKTGEILASSSTPSFDPNTRDISNYENPLVTYLYEPGSTMKTFTYMCAIEKGTYNGNLKFLSGSITIDSEGSKVSDWDPKGWGYLTYDQGFVYSSNVGVANMMKTFLTKSDLRSCLEKYGFGTKTGIELPRELSGNLDFNYDIEVVNAGFGQGITITQIQQLQALTIIANDGSMVKPHIVKKIVDESGNITYESSVEKTEQLVSSETINKMKELLSESVNASYAITSAAHYKMDTVEVLGKSGTAQIYNTQTKKYEDGANSYIYSFAGMFPGDDPEIIIYAAMKKPKYGTSKGVVDATTSIIQNVVKYLQLEEENVNKLQEIEIDSYINKNISILESLKEKLNVIIVGTGDTIIKQYPSMGEVLLEGENLFVVTNGSLKMPNLIGYSRKEAELLLNLIGVEYELSGNGFVTKQSITSGSSIENMVKLTLEDKCYVERDS